jgi:hypothetical protein
MNEKQAIAALIAVRAETARGAFHGAYALPKERRDMHRQHQHRLLDLLIGIAVKTSPTFMDSSDAKGFAVIDLLREEKAFFEMPDGVDADYVQSMIESTFNSRSLRISQRTWVV